MKVAYFKKMQFTVAVFLYSNKDLFQIKVTPNVTMYYCAVKRDRIKIKNFPEGMY